MQGICHLRIQNEFNGDLIRKSVVKEWNALPFLSIMADETADILTTEQLSVCVRYIWEKCKEGLDVCEDF